MSERPPPGRHRTKFGERIGASTYNQMIGAARHGPNGQLGALAVIEDRAVRHAVHLDAAHHVFGEGPVKSISGSRFFPYPVAPPKRIGAIRNPGQISQSALARRKQ